MIQGFLKDRLLCQRKQFLLCYRSGCLYLRSKETLEVIKRLRLHSAIVSLPLIERVLRYGPRTAVSLDDDEFLIADHGCIYNYSISDNRVRIEHRFRDGMKAPLSICARYKNGRLIDLVYGDYFQNPNRDKVAIHRRTNSSWVTVYEFQENSIKHIHNIIDDREHERYLILTGDEDEESGIWESDYDFSRVQKIISGKQQYRSCFLFPVNEDFYFLTDTPLEQNYLYKYSSDKKVTQLSELPGPVIFGIAKNNSAYFATSVEGDSRLKGIRYLISLKIGPGVHDRYSHLYRLSDDGVIRKESSIKKDMLPPGLFEFGNMKFPETDSDDIYICPQSLKSKYGTYKILQ